MPEPSERPPIASAPLSVVLLAHNDGSEIDEVVTAWASHLKGLGREHEILLVDDGSNDSTPIQASKLAERYPAVRLLRHEDHAGPGAALRTGIAAAQYPLLFYTTCDKQYHPADLQRVLETIDKVDLVTGYRVGRPLPGMLVWWDRLFRLFVRVIFGISQEARDCWLGWAGWRRRWVARWIFGVRVRDPECAYRLFRREIFARVPLQTRDFVHVEILAKANFLGCWMAEVPVTCLPGRAKKDVPSPESSLRKQIRELFRQPDFGPRVLPPAMTTTVLQSSEATAVFGQQVTFTATVYPPPDDLTGAITILVDGVEQLRAAPSKGQAVLTTSALNAGLHSIRAVYEGDGKFAGSRSSSLSCFVKPVPTETALTLANTEPSGDITLTAVVKIAAGIAAPSSGTITFKDGAVVLGEIAVTDGVASFTTRLLEGEHTLTAAYQGDNNYAASVSESVPLTIPPATIAPVS